MSRLISEIDFFYKNPFFEGSTSVFNGSKNIGTATINYKNNYVTICLYSNTENNYFNNITFFHIYDNTLSTEWSGSSVINCSGNNYCTPSNLNFYISKNNNVRDQNIIYAKLQLHN
jgi:hypothetical protein